MARGRWQLCRGCRLLPDNDVFCIWPLVPRQHVPKVAYDLPVEVHKADQ